jgi:hypothetical protein
MIFEILKCTLRLSIIQIFLQILKCSLHDQLYRFQNKIYNKVSKYTHAKNCAKPTCINL